MDIICVLISMVQPAGIEYEEIHQLSKDVFTVLLPCSFSVEYIYVTYTLISKTSISSLSKFIRYTLYMNH